MNKHQHGLHTGHSCLSQILAYHEQVLKALDLGIDVEVIYLDFAKAYDRVEDGVLLHKVCDIGICGLLGV